MTDEPIAELQAMLDDRRKDACDRADKLARLRAAEQSARDYIAELTDDQIGSGDDPVGFLVASHRVLANKLTSLSAIVEKLPKTADGVPIVPGMYVYCAFRTGTIDGRVAGADLRRVRVQYGHPIDITDGGNVMADESDPYTTALYSTRALAESAARDARGA